MNLKRIILLLTVAFSLTAQGQRFDWVWTYTGRDGSSGNTNKIVGSCVDTEGNYYFVGECSSMAEICGVRIIPDSIVTLPVLCAVVIGKISPQGTLLWHKAIYSPGSFVRTCGLRQIGDTAFMIEAYFELPYEYLYGNNQRNYRDLYYLDTLLPGNNHYPMPLDSLAKQWTTAFITFRNDGSVIEQHFLCVGWVDSTGHTLTPRYMGFTSNYFNNDGMYNDRPNDLAFDIDSVGNIYMVRRTIYRIINPGTNQEWSIIDGTISGLKILVDGVRPLYCPTQRSALGNIQILKFSPHFDSILASVYIFDSTYTQPNIQIFVNDLNIDSHGNLYINLQGNHITSPLRVSGLNSIFMDTITIPTMMLKYSSELRPIGMSRLSYTGFATDSSYVETTILYSHVDNSSNSIFLTGVVFWPPGSTPTILYGNDTLDLSHHDGFWLRLNMDDLRLLSYAKIRHGTHSDAWIEECMLTTQHNRVFGQAEFAMGVIFGDTMLTTTLNDMAFMVWDYEGQELSISGYNSTSLEHVVSKPVAIDSVVYLPGTLNADATFGTITTRTRGASYAFVAKYVDTAFMTPYVARDTRITQQINWPQVLSFSLSDSPVQLTARSTSGLPVTYTCSDTSIARILGTTLYLMAEGDATITASQGGNSQYRPATPVSKTLHVERTGDTDTLTLTAQQINWQQELTFPLSDDPVQLTATSTSGLPVTYRCNDPSIALIVGSTLYLRGEGDATVTASQNGNSQYRPATPVVKPLHVGHAGIDAGDSQGFAIYPNPAHNAVYYSTDESVKSVQVISSQGRTMEVSFTGNQVDITTLPAGVYYLRFVTESNVYSHKIIKM